MYANIDHYTALYTNVVAKPGSDTLVLSSVLFLLDYCRCVLATTHEKPN
jgi:hypothetical protein